ETIECGPGARASRNDRATERWLRNSFAQLRARDPAAHLRLSGLLLGTFHGRSPGPTPEDEASSRLGAPGVLARTDTRAMLAELRPLREDVRELLRWREILVSLLPEGHRPIRRVLVPGGMTCADPEGPRLSWLWIGGSATDHERGAFAAH